jgi:hypothetical protein
MPAKPIYLPRLDLVQPPAPAHVAEIVALQSRLLYAWGRLSSEEQVRVVEAVEGWSKP